MTTNVYKGDNLKNTHARVIVLVHDTSLNVLYKCMKFHRNICNGYQVIERTQFCDGQTDPKRDRETDPQTDARYKTICLPTLAGGRYSKVL